MKPLSNGPLRPFTQHLGKTNRLDFQEPPNLAQFRDQKYAQIEQLENTPVPRVT